MKRLNIRYITTLLPSLIIVVSAATNPIIFIHGQKGAADGLAIPKYAWRDWHCALDTAPYRSAMEKILTEHYGGYSAGSPFNCDIDSTPQSTGGETRKIYNFSYYHPAGTRGVISLSQESIQAQGW